MTEQERKELSRRLVSAELGRIAGERAVEEYLELVLKGKENE